MNIKEQKISVIIPTLDRLGDLAEMVESLFCQTILPDEVIVIDQSRVNGSELMLKNLFDMQDESVNNKIKLLYIRSANITGSSEARNHGINVSTGDVVFFFDDDVILEKDYIEEVLKTYQKHPDIAGVGGFIKNYNKRSFINTIHRELFITGPFRDNRCRIYTNAKKYSAIDFIETSKLTGCVMSVRRKIVNNYRFDEKFDGYSFGEDVDFSYRVSLNNKIVIIPRAKLWHKSLGPKSDDREHVARQIYFWYYFFRKNTEKNLLNYISYIWLCTGFLINAILRLLFKADPGPLIGLRVGYLKIIKNIKNF